MQNSTEEEKLLPVGTPSREAQSWGTVISIIIIVLMIIIGAYYAWTKRIAQDNALTAASLSATTTQQ